MSSDQCSSYLILTAKGFFFRIRVPKRLQTRVGKRELKKAIAGTNRKAAERQAILYAAQALELFHALEEPLLSKYRSDMVVQVGGTTYTLDKDNTEEELDLLIKRGIIHPSAATTLPSQQSIIFGLEKKAAGAIAPAVKSGPINVNLPLSQAIELYIDDVRARDARFNRYREEQLRSKLLLLSAICP